MDCENLKRAATQAQQRAEHFGVPEMMAVKPSEILALIADAERLNWLDKQYSPVIEGQSYAQPEGELAAYRWTVEEACGDIRAAIDIMCARMQP